MFCKINDLLWAVDWVNKYPHTEIELECVDNSLIVFGLSGISTGCYGNLNYRWAKIPFKGGKENSVLEIPLSEIKKLEDSMEEEVELRGVDNRVLLNGKEVEGSITRAKPAVSWRRKRSYRLPMKVVKALLDMDVYIGRGDEDQSGICLTFQGPLLRMLAYNPKLVVEREFLMHQQYDGMYKILSKFLYGLIGLESMKSPRAYLEKYGLGVEDNERGMFVEMIDVDLSDKADDCVRVINRLEHRDNSEKRQVGDLNIATKSYYPLKIQSGRNTFFLRYRL